MNLAMNLAMNRALRRYWRLAIVLALPALLGACAMFGGPKPVRPAWQALAHPVPAAPPTGAP